MNIVLEGPDGAGKSTLAVALARATGMAVVQGKGPPKSREEFRCRTVDYLSMVGKIFDRHPCISEPIYSRVAGRECMLSMGHLNTFHATRPFIVYVRPTSTRLPDDHGCKDHETPEHVAMVEQNHAVICAAYDERMLTIAHYIHRRTDVNLQSIVKLATQHNVAYGQAWTGFFPGVDAIEQGGRFKDTRSLDALTSALFATLGANFAPAICNKCGYYGIAERDRMGQYTHLKPNSHEVCNYTAVNIEETSVQNG